MTKDRLFPEDISRWLDEEDARLERALDHWQRLTAPPQRSWLRWPLCVLRRHPTLRSGTCPCGAVRSIPIVRG